MRSSTTSSFLSVIEKEKTEFMAPVQRDMMVGRETESNKVSERTQIELAIGHVDIPL